MTWYVARGDVAVATDASEAYGVSAAGGLGGLCDAASIGGELVVADSAIGVSAALELGSEAVWMDGELPVAASAIGVSAAVEVAKLSEAA